MSSLQAFERPRDHVADAEDVRAPIRRWVFITWYPYCRRSDALGQQLGAPSYLVHYLRFKTPSLAPFKYVLQTLKTAWILLRERPDGVLVANPPAVAPLVIWLGSLLLRYRFIVDAHSGAFQHARWSWTLPLQRFIAALEQTGWRVSGPLGAAQLLGLKPTTLEARMKKLGIARPSAGSPSS